MDSVMLSPIVGGHMPGACSPRNSLSRSSAVHTEEGSVGTASGLRLSTSGRGVASERRSQYARASGWRDCRKGSAGGGLDFDLRLPHLAIEQKMLVPGFGDLKSPEGKAADSLHNFFTFVALKVVLSQLRAYNPEAFQELQAFTDRVPIRHGDDWLRQLLREGPRQATLARRIMEVRAAYCKEDFEWDNLQKVSQELVDKSNTNLLREFLSETMSMK